MDFVCAIKINLLTNSLFVEPIVGELSKSSKKDLTIIQFCKIKFTFK